MRGDLVYTRGGAGSFLHVVDKRANAAVDPMLLAHGQPGASRSDSSDDDTFSGLRGFGKVRRSVGMRRIRPFAGFGEAGETSTEGDVTEFSDTVDTLTGDAEGDGMDVDPETGLKPPDIMSSKPEAAALTLADERLAAESGKTDPTVSPEIAADNAKQSGIGVFIIAGVVILGITMLVFGGKK